LKLGSVGRLKSRKGMLGKAGKSIVKLPKSWSKSALTGVIIKSIIGFRAKLMTDIMGLKTMLKSPVMKSRTS